MERQPKFLKDFSKENSPEERQTTAREIRAKRAEFFSRKEHRANELEAVSQEMIEQERKVAEQLEQIQNLQQKIDELSNSKVGKLLNYFELKKLRVELAGHRKSQSDLSNELQTQKDRENSLQSQEQGDGRPEFQEAKEMLKAFYNNEKEKWANSEYNKDEIIKYFSEEHLASLSVEDYALLLKRFPNEMVTHVTRQGIRDHVGTWDHVAGLNKYAGGFMRMIEDGRLRAPLAVYMAEKNKKDALKQYLHLNEFKSREEALNHLNFLLEHYANINSIHFAAQKVVDSLYGSERYNEIFIMYPSAHIASQYYFNGQLTHTQSGEDYWNDAWVWANEERGMDINAGVVFIPKDTSVHRETGSRYELDENNNPLINQESVNAVWAFAKSDDFDGFRNAVEQMYEDLPGYYLQANREQIREEEIARRQVPLKKQLAEQFRINDPRVQDILFYPNGLLLSLSVYRDKLKQGIEDEYMDANIKKEMNHRGVLFVEAQDPVKSEKFWEDHFQKIGKRPSKIVYYVGGSPTRALYQWRHEQGLAKRGEPEHLGFPERRTERSSDIAYTGVDRFRVLAQEVIEEYFQSKNSE